MIATLHIKIAVNELRDFNKLLEEAAEWFSRYQLDVFALSVANPAAIRRRVTDQYEVGRRVIRRRTLYEFELDVPSLARYNRDTNDDDYVRSSADRKAASADDPTYVAVLLSQKGRLHDYSLITDHRG